CGQCGKRFKDKTHLVSHQQTHAGEKPYTCPVCTHAFRTSSALAEHHRIHTGKMFYYTCTECGKTSRW
ncbi:ZN707 protein, partial [Pterocles burchelli]|nr:ZN707 protein [Pterocles burchelli]